MLAADKTERLGWEGVRVKQQALRVTAMAGRRFWVASAWLGLLIIVGNSRSATAQAAVVHAAVASPGLFSDVHDGSIGLLDWPALNARQVGSGIARPSVLPGEASEAMAIDTVVRQSHVGRGALVGLGVGLVFAVFKVAQANRACARSSCDGAPFLDPIVDPVVYGAAGAAIGAVTMDIWSLR